VPRGTRLNEVISQGSPLQMKKYQIFHEYQKLCWHRIFLNTKWTGTIASDVAEPHLLAAPLH
jgi:hypothetical protein